jgi:fructosamine-3-kinase
VIAAAVGRALGAPVAAARRVAGGDINDAWVVELAGGVRAFVKTRAGAAAGEYATEAAGLHWLAAAGVPVPEVLAVGEHFLALGWIEAGRLDAVGEEALGRDLAALHGAGAPAFGAPPPGAPAGDPARNAAPGEPVPAEGLPPGDASSSHGPPAPGLRLGELVLPAGTSQDWPSFYASHRLLAVLPHAGLDGAGRRAVERVAERLPELAGPPEPPARLHGDLWSGNVLAGADGRARLIDPAAHGGHREIDLAMLRLFGRPSPRTLAAYQEAYPLAPGHEERVGLWQLFPLLVHAALFGGGYRAAAADAARRAAPS